VAQYKSEVRDGMRVDWDVPVPMEDGVILRADVFRPVAEGSYPVIMSHGPYAKGLSFQDGFPWAWTPLVADHPEVLAGSSGKYQVWETADPEKWVPDGYVCVRVDSRGAGRSPGYLDIFSPREIQDYYECIEWAGTQPWSNGRVGRAAGPPLRRRALPGAVGGVGEDHRPGSFSHQLESPPAHPWRLRGLRPHFLRAQVAGGARPRSHHRVLRRLRGGAAETVLRALPKGRGHGLGDSAAGPAQRPPRGRQFRAAPGTGVAARAHPVDPAPPAPRERDPGRQPPSRHLERGIRGPRRGPDLHHRAVYRGGRDHRARRRPALYLLDNHRPGPLPHPSRAGPGRPGRHLPERTRPGRRSGHGLAPGLSPGH
jgi:hypothetical protein